MRKNYANYFTWGKRKDEKDYCYLADGRPEELQDFVRSVHFDHFGGCLPNDWIYEQLALAFDELSKDDLEDIAIEADPYYRDLANWLQEPFAHEYCNEMLEELCENPKQWTQQDIYTIIGYAQWLAKDRIYHAVNDWIHQEENC